MRLVDVHCHLESDKLQKRMNDALFGARHAGVERLITAAVHPGQWRLSADLAARHEPVEFAVGVHPWYCSDDAVSSLPMLAGAARGAVAIGECGLDAKTAPYSLERQESVFIAQLKVAQQLTLPMVIHCRGAFNELLAVFRQHGPPPSGVVHNFSGSLEVAEQLAACNLSFSLGGVLTRHVGAKRLRMLRRIFPDHLMLETDAPDLSPVEAAGEINMPANILYTLRAASALLETSPEHVAAVTTQNARRVFRLKS